jgi:hypothetical protein
MARQHRHAAAIEELRRRTGTAVDEIWHDVPARCCALAALAFLWLTAALTEPAFLFLVVAGIATLRFRLRHKPPQTFDDWL